MVSVILSPFSVKSAPTFQLILSVQVDLWQGKEICPNYTHPLLCFGENPVWIVDWLKVKCGYMANKLTHSSRAVRLVDHDSGMRKAVPHVLSTGCKQKCPHTAGLPHTPCCYWRPDVLHCVVDAQSSSDWSTCIIMCEGGRNTALSSEWKCCKPQHLWSSTFY